MRRLPVQRNTPHFHLRKNLQKILTPSQTNLIKKKTENDEPLKEDKMTQSCNKCYKKSQKILYTDGTLLLSEKRRKGLILH